MPSASLYISKVLYEWVSHRKVGNTSRKRQNKLVSLRPYPDVFVATQRLRRLGVEQSLPAGCERTKMMPPFTGFASQFVSVLSFYRGISRRLGGGHRSGCFAFRTLHGDLADRPTQVPLLTSWAFGAAFTSLKAGSPALAPHPMKRRHLSFCWVSRPGTDPKEPL